MDEIITFTGHELTDLLDRFRSLVENDQNGAITSVRVCVDGGFKMKINNGVWTPPLGQAL